MRIYYVNKTGHRHTECEDAVVIDPKINSSFVFDGVSNAKYGGKGSHLLAEGFHEAFMDESTRAFVTNCNIPPEEIRKKICKIRDNILSDACNRLQCRPSDLAATLLITVVYKDKVAVIHAGDGAIFGISECEQSSPVLLTFPDNSEDHSVYSVEHPLQLTRMRIMRFNRCDFKGIISCTDGFSEKYLKTYQSGFDAYGISTAFDRINSNADLEALVREKHLARPAVSDDISAVVMKFDNGVSYNKGSFAPFVSTDSASTKPLKPAEAPQPKKAAPEVGNKSADNRKHGFGVIIFIVLFSFILSIFSTVFIVKHQMRRFNSTEAEISSLRQEISSLNDRFNTTGTSTSEVTSYESEEVTQSTESSSNEADSDEESTTLTADDDLSETQESQTESDRTQADESTKTDSQIALRILTGTGAI